MGYIGQRRYLDEMVYVHHVPRHEAAERLSRVVSGSGDFLGSENVSRDVSRTEENGAQQSETDPPQ